MPEDVAVEAQRLVEVVHPEHRVEQPHVAGIGLDDGATRRRAPARRRARARGVAPRRAARVASPACGAHPPSIRRQPRGLPPEPSAGCRPGTAARRPASAARSTAGRFSSTRRPRRPIARCRSCSRCTDSAATRRTCAPERGSPSSPAPMASSSRIRQGHDGVRAPGHQRASAGTCDPSQTTDRDFVRAAARPAGARALHRPAAHLRHRHVERRLRGEPARLPARRSTRRRGAGRGRAGPGRLPAARPVPILLLYGAADRRGRPDRSAAASPGGLAHNACGASASGDGLHALERLRRGRRRVRGTAGASRGRRTRPSASGGSSRRTPAVTEFDLTAATAGAYARPMRSCGVDRLSSPVWSCSRGEASAPRGATLSARVPLGHRHRRLPDRDGRRRADRSDDRLVGVGARSGERRRGRVSGDLPEAGPGFYDLYPTRRRARAQRARATTRSASASSGAASSPPRPRASTCRVASRRPCWRRSTRSPTRRGRALPRRVRGAAPPRPRAAW